MTRGEPEVAELPTEPGARLRRQRELAGLSEQQVAERLNLDPVVVAALEQDDYATLGAPVFARGHLKRYAALLGLGEDEVLGAYERSRAQLAQPTLVPKAREEMRPERGPARWPWIAGSLLLFLAAAGLAAWVNERGLTLPDWPFGRDATAAAAVEPRASAGGEAVGSDAPVRQAAAEAGPVRPLEGAAGVVVPPADAGSPATTAAVPAGQVVLDLRFAADSWVEIYDASGKTVVYDLGKAGTDRTVSGAAPLSVTFGNAPAVSARANGRPLVLPAPPAGQTVGRYSVGADGVLR